MCLVGICCKNSAITAKRSALLLSKRMFWRRWEPEMEAAGLQREHWRKSSMWSMLLRKHAQAVVDDSEVHPRCCIASQNLLIGLRGPADWACMLGLHMGLGQPWLSLRLPGGGLCSRGSKPSCGVSTWKVSPWRQVAGSVDDRLA